MHGDSSSTQFYATGHGVDMYSVSSSLRDASNQRAPGSESGKGMWKAQPTPIPVPSNSKRSLGNPNPFAGGRMKDTLSNKPHTSGNHTASKTPLGNQGGVTGQRGIRRPRTHGRYSPSMYQPKNPSALKPVIDIDDEDTGEPVARKARTESPDEIGLFPDEPSHSRRSSATSSSSARNPLPFRPVVQRPKWTLPQDGDATQRLEKRRVKRTTRASPSEIIEVVDDEPVDGGALPVEIDSSDPPDDHAGEGLLPLRPSIAYRRQASPTLSILNIAKGKVAEEVSRIESSQEFDPKQIIRQISNERTAAIPNQVKMIDLRTKVSAPAEGLKNRMKPKTPTLQPDPLLQSSGYQSLASTSKEEVPPRSRAQAAKAMSSSSPILLPLEAWVLGRQLVQDYGHEYWISFDGQKLEVKSPVESRQAKLSIRVSDGLGAVTCSAHPLDPNNPVVMKMQTGKAKRKDKELNLGPFRHGAHGLDGTLTFMFQRKHPNWDDGKPYEKLIAQIEKVASTCEFVTLSASTKIWELATFNHQEDDESDGKLDDWLLGPTTVNHDSPGRSRSRVPPRADDEDDNQLRLSSYVPRRATVDRDTLHAQSSTRSSRRTARRGHREGLREESPGNSPVLDADELVLVYPPSSAGAINVTRGDLKRLEPGQYLNDTLIEFGLKLWLNDYREENPELADQVHVFSSFFYKKLNVKDKQMGYQSVRKWTSKFDLFKKKYIIVPINEHLHWYLAIICNPEYILQTPPTPPPKVGPSVLTRKRKREEDVGPVEIPDIDDTPRAPTADTRETTPARSRTGDEAEENSVEELLNDCAISPPEEPQETSLFNDDPASGLMYPPSESDSRMDVDAERHPEVVDINSVAATMAPTLDEQSVDEGDLLTEDDRPDIVEIDDLPMEVDAANIAATVAVPATRFYSSASKKGKERAMSPAVPHPSELDNEEVEVEIEKEDPPEPESRDTNPNKTWIFTFDSLGSKHPAAANNLALYLQLEAQDKKGISPANTTPPGRKHALVPAQPNFCDCGVYLIHFVRAFMKDPRRATEIILNKKPKEYSSREREQDWDAEAVINFRNELMATAESLSDVWKKEKATREEQKRKEAEAVPSGATSEAAADDSDDEIIIGEVISKPKPASTRGKGKAKAPASAATEETKADRLR